MPANGLKAVPNDANWRPLSGGVPASTIWTVFRHCSTPASGISTAISSGPPASAMW